MASETRRKRFKFRDLGWDLHKETKIYYSQNPDLATFENNKSVVEKTE